MNEPVKMPGDTWQTGVKYAIAGIRKYDVTSYIIVEGKGWSGAQGLDLKKYRSRQRSIRPAGSSTPPTRIRANSITTCMETMIRKKPTRTGASIKCGLSWTG